SCPSRGWSASSAATCSTTWHRYPVTTRCWNTATTSRSNAWARAANRARRWLRWRRGRSGARMRSWPGSRARSHRSWAPVRSMSTPCWSSMTSTASLRGCGSACVRALPPEIAALAGKRVALWGWGREGRAAYAALRQVREGGTGDAGSEARFPARLTLFCSSVEAEEARTLGDAGLVVETEATAERLSAFDLVIKSPGISPYRPEVLAAAGQGTRFVGGTALWFAARPDARTVCVTGTKGKSTTSALLAHLLRAGGHRTALTGNIGQPLLELLDGDATYWVVELSSYQTRDVAASGVRPDVALVTNIFPEHLDWHGGQARYVEDKLSLVTDGRPRVAVLNAAD